MFVCCLFLSKVEVRFGLLSLGVCFQRVQVFVPWLPSPEALLLEGLEVFLGSHILVEVDSLSNVHAQKHGNFRASGTGPMSLGPLQHLLRFKKSLSCLITLLFYDNFIRGAFAVLMRSREHGRRTTPGNQVATKTNEP